MMLFIKKYIIMKKINFKSLMLTLILSSSCFSIMNKTNDIDHDTKASFGSSPDVVAVVVDGLYRLTSWWDSFTDDKQ